MARFPNFVGPAYQSQSLTADGERCINLFPEVMEVPGAKAKTVLYPAPGLTSYSSTANYAAGIPVGPFTTEGPCRAMLVSDSALFSVLISTAYQVVGQNLVSLPTTAGASTILNTAPMAIDQYPATISDMGDGAPTLYVTSGGTGYMFIYSGGGLWVGATGPTDVSHGGFLDGFFLALDRSATLHISDYLTPLTWNSTQITQRDAAPDPWISMRVVHRQIWLFGSMTTDVWWNAGNPTFPFAPIDGANLQVGILAPFSVAEVDNAPMWLGRSAQGAGMVYRAQGYSPLRVSHYALEYAIQHYDTADDAIGWSYQQDGHEFYVLEFPSGGETWVYDASTAAALGHEKAWHQRAYYQSATGSGAFEAYRPRYHVFANGTHLVGDRETGATYSLGTNVATDVNGEGIRRVRRTPHLSSEQERLFFQAFELDLETGIGLSTGQGSDPQIMLRWSDDGGRTWSNEHWLSAGALGAYKTRAIWNRLGTGRDRVFEIVCTDPVPWRFVDAFLTVRKGLR